MSYRSVVIVLAVAVIGSALLFHLFTREISATWSAFAVHPELRSSLRAQLADLRSLARLDPTRAADYRRRFEITRQLLNHTEVLEMNRVAMVQRYEQILLLVVALLMTLMAATYVVLRRRDEHRLAQLRESIIALSRGDREAEMITGTNRDLIGRVFAIVGETARVVARDRRRLLQLDHLASWQEAARRLAHEIRTPLTAARMEVSRLRTVSPDGATIDSVLEELDVIATFTSQFTAFGSLPEPRRKAESLPRVVSDFVERFSDAWPNVRLASNGNVLAEQEVSLDREMIRRVLVNLCTNSANALGERMGTVELNVSTSPLAAFVDVVDDAGGIDATIVSRIFTPYVTTRRAGEGMGLGLAISKKIMLDHGGDLELVKSNDQGTHFRLSIPTERP
jgi:signal transduction histidine kinase